MVGEKDSDTDKQGYGSCAEVVIPLYHAPFEASLCG